MQKKLARGSILLLLLIIVLESLTGCAGQSIDKRLSEQREKTANYVMTQIKEPTCGSVGGEWAVMAVKKSGIEISNGYVESYYDNIRALVKHKKGKLSDRYYTEYARVAIVLRSLGYDPTDLEGYDLVKPLEQWEKVETQNFNGQAYSIIALCINEKKGKSTERYLKELFKISKDPFYKETPTEGDYISMLLQAAAYYRDSTESKKVIYKSIDRLKEIQEKDGSFGNCESTAQVIIGLVAVGEDPRGFAKNNVSVAEALLNYVVDDGFAHKKGQKINQMSTEQALLALDAIYAFERNEKLYE